jgi:ABC-2 type transport system permease protein
VLKDVRLFWRDPAQWIQFMIFFGLLCIYVLNLRNVAFNFQNPFWETMISYLNLAASALTLSTLTTRFVFPQFSLEGGGSGFSGSRLSVFIACCSRSFG